MLMILWLRSNATLPRAARYPDCEAYILTDLIVYASHVYFFISFSAPFMTEIKVNPEALDKLYLYHAILKCIKQ